MEKEKKVYIANGKRYGQSAVKFQINLTKLNNAIISGQCNTFQNNNGDTLATVNVYENQEADQYGNTHTMVCDNWKPDPSKKKDSPASIPASDNNPLPF